MGELLRDVIERSLHHRAAEERFHDPARVLALCDGVCAIIITLLVIEIHPPHLGRGETVRHALGELKPSLVGFALSFVVVAIAWVGHRDAFALVRRTDRGLVWLNILYLFPLCLVPFGSALLTSFWEDTTALRLYGLLLVTISVTRLIMWLYATARPALLFEPVDHRSRVVGILAAVVPGAVYAIGIAVAALSPRASITIYGVVPLLYILLLTVARSSGPPQTFERDFS